ncbi:hypothetical protein SHDE107825_04125 [Shewanella denitrificans]
MLDPRLCCFYGFHSGQKPAVSRLLPWLTGSVHGSVQISFMALFLRRTQAINIIIFIFVIND